MREAQGCDSPPYGFWQEGGDPTHTRALYLCANRVTIFLFESGQFRFGFFRIPLVDEQAVFPVKEISPSTLEPIIFGQVDGCQESLFRVCSQTMRWTCKATTRSTGRPPGMVSLGGGLDPCTPAKGIKPSSAFASSADWNPARIAGFRSGSWSGCKLAAISVHAGG